MALVNRPARFVGQQNWWSRKKSWPLFCPLRVSPPARRPRAPRAIRLASRSLPMCGRLILLARAPAPAPLRWPPARHVAAGSGNENYGRESALLFALDFWLSAGARGSELSAALWRARGRLGSRARARNQVPKGKINSYWVWKKVGHLANKSGRSVDQRHTL